LVVGSRTPMCVPHVVAAVRCTPVLDQTGSCPAHDDRV